jgi:8-oxo-dGTP pyrophosphatase MutT (NUDIX family)
MSQSYCNNCGKHGHSFNNCKVPITSFGIIAFRKSPTGVFEYLMIRRKDTLGYVDFMRGKYSIYNKDYIMNMIKQMTEKEKDGLLYSPFDILWHNLWGESALCESYRAEETISRDKLTSLRQGVCISANNASIKRDSEPESYYYLPSVLDDVICPNIINNVYSDTLPTGMFSIQSMIEESRKGLCWEEAEWGFPKGRRNYQEKDYDCAVREFCEETGYVSADLIPLMNLFPYEEIFTGSNYKSYKHKYYLTYMDYDKSLRQLDIQTSEISCAEWKTYDECMKSIRCYNLEKKNILTQINEILENYVLFLEHS